MLLNAYGKEMCCFFRIFACINLLIITKFTTT